MIDANTVLEVFAKRVKEHPDKLALKFRDIELTYAQLDEISNRLANYLITKGVTTETLVPVCVHSPLDMVIGIWGIIKTGAAYVPIDAEFPEDRIKYMIEDTGAKLVVFDSLTTRFLAAAEGKEIVLADDDWKVAENSPATDPKAKVGRDNVVYIIYTSGSTGKPKGVLIEHKSVIDYIGGLFDRLPYEECRSFALGVSFAADSVITHLFGALMFGKELHVFFKEDYNNVEYIHN